MHSEAGLPRPVVLDAVRRTLEELRLKIRAGETASVPSDEAICRAARGRKGHITPESDP